MTKIISFATVLALATVLTTPMSVFATDITEKSLDSKEAETTVELNVDPEYTITIPATVTLAENSSGKYENESTVSAKNVLLNEGSKIIVTLASSSEFHMVTPEAESYKLPYTACGDFGDVSKTTGGKVAEFVTVANTQEVKVSFITDEEPAYAGVYSDIVVFTIEIEKAE